ncbi:hypothetical protein E2C01_054701 [Portunus trituberculatus]|uniref:NtA domain-containing protein n=1 Tax=Portunus trituberculatus TaxID=210409 RepID=A0A5B7GSQ3_PORTR|nr:hypothetical protein [Portunus trituberculatus]
MMWVSKRRTMLAVVCVVLVVVASAGGPRLGRLRRQGTRKPNRTRPRLLKDQQVPPVGSVPREIPPPRTRARAPVCPDRLPLEERRDQADLVFTGRIEWLHGRRKSVSRHSVGAAGVAGGVKVKRVLKGPSRYNGEVVEVMGLGRWNVCNSLARVKDTKIFLTSLDEQGRISLNSSLVRLTLKTLRTAAASPRASPGTEGEGRGKCMRSGGTNLGFISEFFFQATVLFCFLFFVFLRL